MSLPVELPKGDKFVLIGNGYIGQRHIDAIRHIGKDIVAICDIDQSRKVEGIPFTQHHEFLTSIPGWKEVSTVVIATPNDLHSKMILWARKHGKRVLCEKPPATNSKAIWNMLGLLDVHFVLQLRHHPVMEKLLSMQEPDKVKLYIKVQRDKSYWDGWKGDEERSGGILFNLGVHYFDALSLMFGTEIGEVKKDIDEPDCVAGSIMFLKRKTPVQFHIQISEDDKKMDRYIRIDGKTYRFSNQQNLSMEDLHNKVYENLDSEPGPKEVYKLMKMIDRIKYA